MSYRSNGFLNFENLKFIWTGYGDDVISHFRKKRIFRDIRDNQENDAKTMQKPLEEVASLKMKLT